MLLNLLSFKSGYGSRFSKPNPLCMVWNVFLHSFCLETVFLATSPPSWRVAINFLSNVIVGFFQSKISCYRQRFKKDFVNVEQTPNKKSLRHFAPAEIVAIAPDFEQNKKWSSPKFRVLFKLLYFHVNSAQIKIIRTCFHRSDLHFFSCYQFNFRRSVGEVRKTSLSQRCSI